MRSDRRPKWARRRAPREGALLERWLAQCGVTRSTIPDRVIVRIVAVNERALLTRYTDSSAFLSPAAALASGPHQSTSWRAT